MSSDRQTRIPAPTAEDLGVERVRWRKLGTLTLWTLREVFLRWRGYAALGAIAILMYLLQYGLPLDFIATPWKELFDAAAAAKSWLGVPWQDLSQMAGTLVVRGIVSALLATPVLAAITAAAWMVLLMRRSTGVYADADLASVITIDAKSQAQAVRWIVSRHLARRKHQGQGVQLREALRAAIVAKYAETDLTIEARVRDERLRILLQHQFPLVQTDGQMLRATPADLTLGDELGRDSSPGTVAAAVRSRAVNRERGSVSAIVAPWGAGKTWIVKHAITMLEFPDDGSTPVRVLQFNPWLFADESALFAGFSELILSEIRGWRTRRNVARFLKLIGPASKYGPVDISTAALVVGGMLESPSSPSSVFRALDRAMSKTKKPICIVMDDIDRLNPDELIMLFKLVRLVGNLRGVSYLLAMDENTVLELIGSTSVADSNPERARAYLEKIIDFKHRVPPLTFEQIHDRGFEEAIRFANSEGIEIHRRSYESLEWIYDQSLSRRLTTVRALDRFIAEVKSISPSIYREIDFKDWCLAAFLRSQMPMVWTYVIDHKNDFLGKLSSLTLDMEKEAAKEFANRLPTTLTQLGLSVDGVGIATDVLRSMFPAASLTGGSILMSGSTVDEAEARYGIGHEDFFDRYTWVGLPPTDVSDHEILTVLRRLGDADAQVEAERELLAVYRSQPNTVLERMRRNHAKEGIVKLALLKFLAGVLPKRDNMMAAFSRDRSPVVLVAGWLVGALEESEYDQVFGWAAEPSGSATDLFLELLQRRGRFWHASSPIETRMSDLQVVLVDRLLAVLRAAPCPTINDYPLREYAMDLRRIDDQAFGVLARELISEGQWRAADAVALFITRFLPSEDSVPRHTGVSERQLRAALGDDAILDMYPLEGVERPLRDCLASEDNNDYVLSDVSTMRATAAGAVAQIAEKIRAERRG